MFEDIAQMEKEIETFRKNIVASSELVKGIVDLTEMTRFQKDSFASSTENLIKKLDACVLQFHSDHEASLLKLEDSNSTAIGKLQQIIAEDMQNWISSVEKIKTAIEIYEATSSKNSNEQIKHLTSESERILSEMNSTIAEQQKLFTGSISQTEEAIRGYQVQAETKYNDFVQRLEATNVDQIFKEVQDLKKSIQKKFIILLAGISVSSVAAIISIIVK